ncbi:uncharacterized protein LOC119319340 [Triticum dicoccoides]|uniref:uncharacterized protein LOC119319340 n=1 Tax=Triticum dicoccoides TaxID=85692 RepID=UPI001891919E|nr:uncharacterized protein LOC119319340 [Triticum dicoccoides]
MPASLECAARSKSPPSPASSSGLTVLCFTSSRLLLPPFGFKLAASLPRRPCRIIAPATTTSAVPLSLPHHVPCSAAIRLRLAVSPTMAASAPARCPGGFSFFW